MQLKLGTLIMGMAGILSGLVMTGCNSDTPAPDPVAYISFYHTSPDAGDLDVYDNNTSINDEPFEYGVYSGYVGFLAGLHELSFTASGTGSVLLSESINFEEDKLYSFFIAGETSSMDAIVTEDTPTSPSTGNVKVRFVHMSPDAGLVDFAEVDATEPLYSDFDFKSTMDFEEMAAGMYDFEARDAAAEEVTVLATESDVELTAGKFYTIILQGYAEEGQTNALEFNVIEH